LGFDLVVENSGGRNSGTLIDIFRSSRVKKEKKKGNDVPQEREREKKKERDERQPHSLSKMSRVPDCDGSVGAAAAGRAFSFRVSCGSLLDESFESVEMFSIERLHLTAFTSQGK